MRRSMIVSLVSIMGAAVLFLLGTLASGNSPKLGLDLQGGASVVLAPAPGQQVKSLGEAVKIIRRRVNGLGVSEANVTQQGNNIIVELPGVQNQDRALSIVGQTAQLEFRHVLTSTAAGGVYDPSTGLLATTANPTTTTPGSTTTTTPGATTTVPATTVPATSTTKGALGAPQVQVAGLATQVATTPTTPAASPATTAVPTKTPTTTPATTPQQTLSAANLTPKSQITPDKQIIVPELKPGTQDITAVYVLDKAELTGSVISSAQAEVSTQVGSGWDVRVNFNGSGSSKFDALAKKYYQSQVAIVLDGTVESAPTINAQQFNGTAIISGGGSGGFTHGQASDLSLVLRYGSLPVQLQQQTVQKVSATLGKDSLRAGLIAGIIGLILVLLYMILYYRALGLVVLLGLSVSGALLYSIITYLGTTHFGLALSLSGVTGIVVSVGVTVDSYIVYFERLKDEIRAGRSVRSSVDRGFGRAWRTIVSADLVSLIGAGLLWWLSVGQVRGFAFFLGLSTLLDLLVAYTFTRPMVVALGRNRTFTQARFLGVARGLAITPAGGAS
jgi:preprotein translocase subunit SecD